MGGVTMGNNINGVGGQTTMMSEVERLKKERDDLINEGYYTPDDPLIMELDRQIRVK